MIPYLIVFSFSIYFTLLANKKLCSKGLLYIYSIIAILLPSLLAGFRDYAIGTDTIHYLNYFNNSLYYSSYDSFLMSYPNVEPAFLLLNYIISRFSHEPIVYLFIIHFIIISLIYISAFKIRNNIEPTWFMFMFLFMMYNESLNAMRQYLALALSLFAFVMYFNNKKIIKYILLIIIATMFHRSAVICFIMIPIFYWTKYFTVRDNYKQLYFYVSIFLLLIIFGKSFLLPLLTDSFEGKYEGYLSTNVVGGVSLSSLLVYLITFYYIYHNTRKLGARIMDVFLIISLFAVFIMLFSIYSVQLYRLSLYFFIIVILAISYIFQKISDIKYEIKIFFMILFMFFWFYSYCYRGSHATIPYVFIY